MRSSSLQRLSKGTKIMINTIWDSGTRMDHQKAREFSTDLDKFSTRATSMCFPTETGYSMILKTRWFTTESSCTARSRGREFSSTIATTSFTKESSAMILAQQLASSLSIIKKTQRNLSQCTSTTILPWRPEYNTRMVGNMKDISVWRRSRLRERGLPHTLTTPCMKETGWMGSSTAKESSLGQTAHSILVIITKEKSTVMADSPIHREKCTREAGWRASRRAREGFSTEQATWWRRGDGVRVCSWGNDDMHNNQHHKYCNIKRWTRWPAGSRWRRRRTTRGWKLSATSPSLSSSCRTRGNIAIAKLRVFERWAYLWCRERWGKDSPLPLLFPCCWIAAWAILRPNFRRDRGQLSRAREKDSIKQVLPLGIRWKHEGLVLSRSIFQLPWYYLRQSLFRVSRTKPLLCRRSRWSQHMDCLSRENSRDIRQLRHWFEYMHIVAWGMSGIR